MPAAKEEKIDNFLSFIAIYEDYARDKRFKKLLFENRWLIKGKTVVEAGAGLGNIAQFILDLGARKVFAVEQNVSCAQFLKKRFKRASRVEVVCEKIEKFLPPKGRKIDCLFQELYGPLLLDESILSLERIKFEPSFVVPDGGALLGEAVMLDKLNDPTIDKRILGILEGALITDLFLGFKFKKPFVVAQWRFRRKAKAYEFNCKMDKRADILALGMEVRHGNKRVAGTQDCFNWPFVFTPLQSTEFNLSFSYEKGATQVYFNTGTPMNSIGRVSL